MKINRITKLLQSRVFQMNNKGQQNKCTLTSLYTQVRGLNIHEIQLTFSPEKMFV
jgi:hypothetical protein